MFALSCLSKYLFFSGAQLGTVFAMPISGLLCDSGFLGGWPSVFYIFGESYYVDILSVNKFTIKVLKIQAHKMFLARWLE